MTVRTKESVLCFPNWVMTGPEIKDVAQQVICNNISKEKQEEQNRVRNTW